MKLSRVPVSKYKKYFIILLCVFIGVFILQFVSAMLSDPIIKITVNGSEIASESPLECSLNAAVAAFLVGGIVNVFLTIKFIKVATGMSHWPAAAVVFMTLFIALEMLIGALLTVPNIILFGVKGFVKKSD